MSRPARGAWVEIILAANTQIQAASRPARGAWVEIRNSTSQAHAHRRRAPQGARGLKYSIKDAKTGFMTVAPRKGRVG